MKKRIGFLALGLLAALNGMAQQDKHFSMFAESPVYINPATAGFSDGGIQLFSNYRTQWGSISDNPYKTTTVGADWRMMEDEGFMGAGVNFLNDVAGDGRYKINEIAVPVSYAIKLAKKRHLAIGLQPGWYQRSLQNDNLTWDNQWTGTEFNTSLPNNETVLQDNRTVNRFDISAGAYYNAVLSKQNRISLGMSFSHLGGQKVNFTTLDSRLYRKLIFHGQFVYSTSDEFSVIPAFYTFFQGPNREFTLGSNFRYLVKGSAFSDDALEWTALSLGVYYRTGDALLVNLMCDIQGFSLGASYDLNTSGLSLASSGNGALEFFLRYRMKSGKK
ncbi:MAG: PorP/SprF family type IX secretion system membrane protein [Bacteroidota bacterium]